MFTAVRIHRGKRRRSSATLFPMDMKGLTDFAALQERRFKKMSAGGHTETERLFAQTVKLGEEVGELCEAILAHAGEQRKDKLAEHTMQHLEHELADCVIVLFIIADKLGVDLPKALTEKIAIVNERFKDVEV